MAHEGFVPTKECLLPSVNDSARAGAAVDTETGFCRVVAECSDLGPEADSADRSGGEVQSTSTRRPSESISVFGIWVSLSPGEIEFSLRRGQLQEQERVCNALG